MRITSRLRGAWGLLLGLWMMNVGAMPSSDEALRDAIQAQFETRSVESAPAMDRAVADFYARRQFDPLWAESTRRERLAAALGGLSEDGLDPAEYAPLITDDTLVAAPVEQARLEVETTRRVLLAILHLHLGKVDPTRLYASWNFTRPGFSAEAAAAALEQALTKDDFAGLVEQSRPPHWLYGRLRLALQHLREIEAAGGWPLLAPGASLKPGMVDPRVVQLRERLRITGDGPPETSTLDPTLYDGALEEAVRAYQRRQYLEADGAVGRATRAALDVPVAARIEQLRVNLERARWLLDRNERRFVLVDIAGYRASYFRDAERVWTGRVQVGRPYRRTPSYQAQITYVTFNPTWTVPPTILREDILPRLVKEPDYLRRSNIRVLDLRGRELAPGAVDLSRPGSYLLRQDAGPTNPLGQVVIRFPSRYAIYMHDTPSQALFDKPQRAFSSGCIRVERALELTQLLFDDAELWSRDAINALVATGETRDVSLPKPLPILIAYWTVDVEADGSVAFRKDLYDRDAGVLQALDAPPQASR